ncbi:sensor histidine kinase [Kaarinaea lacus]
MKADTTPQSASMFKSIYIWVLVALIITFLVFGVFIIELTENYAETNARRELLARTNVAAINISPSVVGSLTGTDRDLVAHEYQVIKQQLIAVKRASDDMRFVYLMKQVGNNIVFLVDAEPEDSEDYSPPGQIYEYPSDRLVQIFRDGVSFVEGPITDEWGTWVSGHAPIISGETGEVIAIIGIDINAKLWEKTLAIYRWGCISITFLLIVLAAVYFFALWRIDRVNKQRLLAADELENVVEDLKQTNKELDAFSYSVSHDLRAPLRHIIGFSQIICDECSDQLSRECVDYFTRIQGGAKKMDDLIDGLLGLSRINRKELEASRIDFSGMSHEVVEQLRQQNQGRNIDVTIQENMTAYADPELLRVVLQNLLTNAWKFTRYKEQARLEIGCNKESGSTVYFVSDNGVGFNEKYKDKIFSAFQRLHQADEFEGMGIGLSTVSRIIRRHKGKIWARGKENEGATFYFTLGL